MYKYLLEEGRSIFKSTAKFFIEPQTLNTAKFIFIQTHRNSWVLRVFV